ncbi:low density lipoprotein receptor adapter protein 1-A-like [Liolophura sinensis]|uniref:low density lipoprotein receptor adapter protein 1-A-like n=1 Tax=Liolophura sinensis TaxID=3198878 RepID=UPI0031591275
MFGRKKSSVDITPGSPVFYVRYVGSTETFVASGRGCTRAPVQKIWDSAQDESEMRRVSVTISPSGICVRDLEKKDDPGIKFPIEDISYCNADSDINVKIFSWISKSVESNKIKCHVVLCSSLEKARAMALVLSRAFQIAYKEWKADKKRIQRKKSSSSTHGSGRSGSGKSKQTPQGPETRPSSAGEHTHNDLSSQEDKSLNITHDESSMEDEPSRDDESVTENNAIIDPVQLEAIRHDDRVQEALAGDGCTQAPSPSAPKQPTAADRNSGGLVMV